MLLQAQSVAFQDIHRGFGCASAFRPLASTPAEAVRWKVQLVRLRATLGTSLMNQDDLLVGVAEPLRANLLARGFTQLTRVQDAILARGLENVDLRITSETGSGKTVALGMVLAHQWTAERGGSGPRALVITPTRELANQVRDELSWLFRGLPNCEVGVVTGGTSILMERRMLARGPQVLVGTPGRLHDHIRGGALNCGTIAQVVLDEADQMLDMGFRDDLDAILATTPEKRRTHLVSATFPGAVAALAKRYQSDVCHVQGTELGKPNADIQHIVHFVHFQQRYAALVNLLLLAPGERTLVFVRTREDTNGVAERLAHDGFSAMPLSGDLAQAQRTRTLGAFRSGALTVLVATDVAARGLDVPNISTVVHFDAPTDPDIYTHRSGRTGRAGISGRSILFVPPAQQYRVRQVLQAAGVHAQLQPPPSVAQVQKAARKEFRRSLHEKLSLGDEVWQDQREYAERLLAEQDPVKLVSTLLQAATTKLVTEPREITPIEPREERRPMPSRPGYGRNSKRGEAPSEPPSSRFTRRPQDGQGASGGWRRDREASPSAAPWTRAQEQTSAAFSTPYRVAQGASPRPGQHERKRGPKRGSSRAA